MSTMVSQATDPHRSVVVEACAGSGKTWMLVTRVFRLLMAGAPSDSILAITFTRKAAQEMTQRLDELLEQCVLLPDEDLLRLLVQRCCELPESGAGQVRDMALSVIRARRAVEINTFHGWFTSLCQMAPATMGFSRTAEPSEMQAYWLDAAWTDWMRLLESPDAQPPVRDAFGQLVQLAGVGGAKDMLFALAGQRAAWRLMRQALGDDGLQDSLADDFRFETLRDAQAAFFDDGGVRAHLSVVLKHFEADGKTNRDAAADLVQAFESRSVDLLTSALRTQKGLPRAFKLGKGQLGKLSLTEVERFDGALQALQDSLDGLQHQLTDLHWYRLTACALNLLPHFLERLDVVKAQADVIDFDDLEMTAADIMADEQASAWVRMRLDRRTRHLLLDEFQDTNPLQWLILRNWLTASGSDDGNTVFMVGDPKQSIYRFRRAEARLFAHVRDWMVDHLNAIVLRTDQSRRCSTSVLAAVNAAFTGENPPRKGRTPVQAHTGLHDSPGDGLYVFPLVGQEGGQADGQADVADATQVTEDAQMVETTGNVEPAQESPAAEPLSEAQLVALTLQHWKQTGQIARWDEVMVLVRRHKDAVPLGQALQALAVPHSITDRSGRFASLIWEDSLALLRVLLSELNEASVLHLLRSPFFSLQPADLEAWLQQVPRSGEQTGTRLWLAASQVGGEVAAAFGTLERWRQWSATLPLHDVLERIFRETDIEAATVAAAPAQESELARRHWAWMLDWALDLNKGRCPHPVLALQEAARLSEHGGAAAGQDSDLDALRILTIHSAKGLEADIVWLLDANRLGGGDRTGDIHTLLNWPVGEDVPRHLSLHGGDKARGRARAEHFAREDEALADEADHLLYVAMTRAKRRICVSGTAARLTKADREAGMNRSVVDGSWYGILSGLPVAQAGAWLSGQTQVQSPPHSGTSTLETVASADRARWEALPPLAGAQTSVGEVRALDDTPATLRGQAWHACLQHVSPAFFARFDSWWEHVSALPDCGQALCALDEDALEQVRSRLQSMSGSAALRPFLDPDAAQSSFNEFEWMDAQGRLHRADRIVCMDGVWTVIDYKWAWTEADLPAYREQLRRYAAALKDTLAAEASRIDGVLISSQGEIIHLSDLRTGCSAKG